MIYRDCQEALTLRLFRDLPEHALATKALDGETKELIALGISVAIRCDDCIAFHAKAALKQGANRERQYASAFHAELQHVGSMANLLLSPNRIYFEIDNSAAISIFYN
jgi:AhpD family alkylhydroperoxidase